MAGEIDSELREELIECQKARSEFVKWKLFLVAALGSASLGLIEKATALPYLLALVPLVCIYVDSVCLHNDSRIMMIARFMRTSNEVSAEARAYEEFCEKNRWMFYNEGLALFGSSLFLSIAVAVLAVWRRLDGTMEPAFVALLVFSGLLGVVVTLWLWLIDRQIQEGKRPLQLLSRKGDHQRARSL